MIQGLPNVSLSRLPLGQGRAACTQHTGRLSTSKGAAVSLWLRHAAWDLGKGPEHLSLGQAHGNLNRNPLRGTVPSRLPSYLGCDHILPVITTHWVPTRTRITTTTKTTTSSSASTNKRKHKQDIRRSDDSNRGAIKSLQTI